MMSFNEEKIMEQGFNFIGTHGHLRTTEVEILMAIENLVNTNPALSSIAPNGRKTVDFVGLRHLLILVEEEKKKIAGADKTASANDLKLTVIHKYWTTLGHLQAHPISWKYLKDQYVESEEPINWGGHLFSAGFWKKSDLSIRDTYVLIFIIFIHHSNIDIVSRMCLHKRSREIRLRLWPALNIGSWSTTLSLTWPIIRS